MSSTSDAEAEVKEYLTKFTDAWFKAFSDKDPEQIDAMLETFGIDDETVWIRPSGNPAGTAIMKAMMISEDVVASKQKIVEFSSVRFLAGGNVAVVTFLEESAFVYKGTPNEDLAKWTAVLEKVDGKWKYVHGHRGTGQPPK